MSQEVIRGIALPLSLIHISGNRRAEVLGEIAYLRALAYFNVLVRYCEFWDMNSEYGVCLLYTSYSGVTRTKENSW